MKCSKHYEKDAISQCVDCGKGLCPECTNKYSIPLCDKCALGRTAANKQLLIRNSILMGVLFVFGFAGSVKDAGIFSGLVTGLIFAGIPWGWSALNKITPNLFLFLPLMGWIIYFVVKLIISGLIGIFITPFKINQVVKGLKEAKELEAYANNIS